MTHESLIIEPIVENIPVQWESVGNSARARQCEGNRIDAGLELICGLDPTFPLLLNGRAHGLVHGPSGTKWARMPDGGAKGQIVLAPRDQPTQWIRIGFTLVKGRGPGGWLTIDLNPTTALAGDNVHPATFADANGEFVDFPSSAPRVINRIYRLGFYMLEDLVQQATSSAEPLFDPPTREAIERGEAHVVRAQFCAYLPVSDVSRFLQVLAIMFGQRIATGKGVIQVATHLGFEFEMHAHDKSHEVTDVLLKKNHGTKPLFSLYFYNKEVRLRQMRQRKGLPADETATVLENVRFDITLHSEGIKALVGEARRWLKSIPEGENDPLKQLRENVFVEAEPQSTVWWLVRAIFVLSHRPKGDEFCRRSFASFLVPNMLREALHLDVLTKFTSGSLQRFLRLDDEIAGAWRSAKPSELKNWAGRLAKTAGCSRPTVYARQKKWLADYGIDIALPYALYRDLLHSSASSFMEPENRSALAAAVSKGNGDEAVRLLAKAAENFDAKRIEIVGSAVSARPHAMSLRVAAKTLPRWKLAQDGAAAINAENPVRKEAARLAAPKAAAPRSSSRPASPGSAPVDALSRTNEEKRTVDLDLAKGLEFAVRGRMTLIQPKRAAKRTSESDEGSPRTRAATPRSSDGRPKAPERAAPAAAPRPAAAKQASTSARAALAAVRRPASHPTRSGAL